MNTQNNLNLNNNTNLDLIEKIQYNSITSTRTFKRYTYNELQGLFHLPKLEAAIILKLNSEEFRQNCREVGISRWPYKLENDKKQRIEGSFFNIFKIDKSDDKIRKNRDKMGPYESSFKLKKSVKKEIKKVEKTALKLPSFQYFNGFPFVNINNIQLNFNYSNSAQIHQGSWNSSITVQPELNTISINTSSASGTETLPTFKELFNSYVNH